MSNKMLTKRLLAAGMSVAMSAMLFATNSLTTFAEESAPELSAPVQASDVPEPISDGGDENSKAPEEEAPAEEKDPDNYSEVVFEKIINCCGDEIRVVETKVTENEYYSDEGSKNEDGSQSDEYQESTQEDTADQTLDYTEIQEIKSSDASVILVGSDKEEVTVKDEVTGDDVRLELPADFDRGDFEEVLAVEKEDGSYERLPEDECVFFGYFTKEGLFVPDPCGWNKETRPYIITGVDEEGNNLYKVADTIYSVKDVCGRSVLINEDMYKAITGDDTSKYETKKEYHYNNQTYSEDELKALENEIKEVKDWEYTTKAHEEVRETETSHFMTTEPVKPAPHLPGPPRPGAGQGNSSVGQTKEVEKPVDVHLYKRVVTGEGTFKQGQFTYPVDIYFTYEGQLYVYQSEYKTRRNLAVGAEELLDSTKKHPIDTSKTDVYKVTQQANEEVTSTEVKVAIYNGDKLIWEGSKEDWEYLKANVKADNVTLVEGKLAVTDKKGKEHILDYDFYSLIHEYEHKLEVTNSYYYTVQDKNETKVVEFEIDGKAYKLSINFWENSRIIVDAVTAMPHPTKEGYEIITVKYSYSSYEDGRTPTISKGEFTYEVSTDDFGSTGEAVLTIKYDPVYKATNSFPREERVVIPSEYITKNVLPQGLLLTISADDGILVGDLIDAIKEKKEPEKLEEDDLFHTVSLIGPQVAIKKVEPAPSPSPNEPDTTPDNPTTTTIEETTVALAPTGAVLGAQRATEEGGAVLGASRARGTADETTAPIVRVLVMAAVAGTALFLTRKREENN